MPEQTSPSNPTKPRVVTDPHLLPRRPLPVTDIRQTKEYKTAARRWLSTIVALPIVIYTSYELWQRTYGNKKQKRLVPGEDER